MKALLTPDHFGIPHDSFRDNGQLDAIIWARGEDKIKFLDAPPGSGKTTIARGFGHQNNQALALCGTKFLQTFYEKYEYVPLFGRGNYACLHPKAEYWATAEHCFHRRKMSDCDVYAECEYVIARNRAKQSPFVVMNYPLWFYMMKKWETPNTIVFDEAHLLPQVTMEFAGIEITERKKKKLNLDDWPAVMSSLHGNKRSIEVATDYLRKCVSQLSATMRDGSRSKTNMELDGERERLVKEASTVIELLEVTDADKWFVESGTKRVADTFRVLPLTAHDFMRLLVPMGSNIMMMSATPGDINTLMDALAIDKFAYRQMDHSIPVERRPVFDLGCPKMGWKSTDQDKGKQIDMIAEAIKECPSDWPGLVLTTSKNDANTIAVGLAARGLSKRIFLTNESNTAKSVAEWHNQMRREKGSIWITWHVWEGYDGVKEKFVIVAKAPYPFIGDNYGKIRMTSDRKMYLQQTASKMEQACGRVRRSDADYNDPVTGEPRTVVMIADGGWTSIKKYLSPHFRESIRSWR